MSRGTLVIVGASCYRFLPRRGLATSSAAASLCLDAARHVVEAEPSRPIGQTRARATDLDRTSDEQLMRRDAERGGELASGRWTERQTLLGVDDRRLGDACQ